MNIHKYPLDLDLYSKYSIDQSYSAFKIIIEKIEASQADDLEYEYATKGYKIFHSEMERIPKSNKFTLTLITAYITYTF